MVSSVGARTPVSTAAQQGYRRKRTSARARTSGPSKDIGAGADIYGGPSRLSACADIGTRADIYRGSFYAHISGFSS